MIVFFTVLANSDCFFFIPFDIMSLFWHFFQVRLFSHFNILLFRLFSLFNLSLISTLSNFNSFFISIFVSYRFFPCYFFFHNNCSSHPNFYLQESSIFRPACPHHTKAIPYKFYIDHTNVIPRSRNSFNHNLFAHPYIYWP